jgi:hypothetical protein
MSAAEREGVLKSEQWAKQNTLEQKIYIFIMPFGSIAKLLFLTPSGS